MRDRVHYLERVLEEEREARTEERPRHDTLMAQLTQRIPELEAPREPREADETDEEEPEEGRAGPMPQALGRAYRGPGGAGSLVAELPVTELRSSPKFAVSVQ
jgi:hypothetical protein